MSDVRIRTNAKCILNYCDERLVNYEDSAGCRAVFRQIIAHAKEILKAEAEESNP